MVLNINFAVFEEQGGSSKSIGATKSSHSDTNLKSCVIRKRELASNRQCLRTLSLSIIGKELRYRVPKITKQLGATSIRQAHKNREAGIAVTQLFPSHLAFFCLREIRDKREARIEIRAMINTHQDTIDELAK